MVVTMVEARWYRRARGRDRRVGVYFRRRWRPASVRYYLLRHLGPMPSRTGATAFALERRLVNALPRAPVLPFGRPRAQGRTMPIARVAHPAYEELPTTPMTATNAKKHCGGRRRSLLFGHAPPVREKDPPPWCALRRTGATSPTARRRQPPSRRPMGRRQSASTRATPREPSEPRSVRRSPAHLTIDVPRFAANASSRGAVEGAQNGVSN